MCILYDIVIGLITGAVSGWLTGVLVTRYYRKKDNERDKEKYVQDLKRHIVSIYRILREIEISSEDERKIEQVENLRRELLYSPRYEKRYSLSEQEDKVLKEYNKNLKNLKDELSEYSRCKNVISILVKYPDTAEEKKDLVKTKMQYETAIKRLGAYSSVWLILTHDTEK